MIARILFVLLLFALATGGAFLLLDRQREPGATLAEIEAGRGMLSQDQPVIWPGQANGKHTIPMMGLEVEVIFYAVLGVCAAVLMLRVLISVLQSLNLQRRGWKKARQEQGERAPIDPVIVPVSTRQARQEDGIPSVAAPPIRLRDRLFHLAHGSFTHMVLTFAGIVAVFGLLTGGLVYWRLHRSLSEQILLRAHVTAVNVGDGAAPFLFKNNAAGMRELLRKQARKPALAYILVEDRKKHVFAHSLETLPEELAHPVSPDGTTAQRRRVLRIGDGSVYELTAPILEGRQGTVRVGIWREEVEQEIRKTIMPLMMWLVSLMSAGVLVAMFLAWHVYRPILRLVSAAKAISAGALDTPTPHVQDTGEVGELSRAIERMRSSVKAAMTRLSH